MIRVFSSALHAKCPSGLHHPVLSAQMTRTWFVSLYSFSFLQLHICKSPRPLISFSISHSLEWRVDFKHSMLQPGLWSRYCGFQTATSSCNFFLSFITLHLFLRYMAPTCFPNWIKIPTLRIHSYLPTGPSCCIRSCTFMPFLPSGHSLYPRSLLRSLGLFYFPFAVVPSVFFTICNFNLIL